MSFGFAIVTSMSEGYNTVVEEKEEGFEASTNQHHPFDLSSSYSNFVPLDISGPKRFKMSRNSQPQDADYSSISSLSDELENLIFAKIPRSEYWKLCFVNKRCLKLLKCGELYKIRKTIGFQEPSVFMFASGESSWWAFVREFKSRWKLPVLPSDPCFTSGDKESICAGTHLLVSGKEIDGLVVWRYELAQNRWYKGPSMISPRCLFASATCGDNAYVAGGVGPGGTLKCQVYDTAERYDPDTRLWDQLPRMKKRRKLCAGCYMDKKFYVIGGRNDEGELTCGEYFDEISNRWELIPDMLKEDPVQSSQSPPLVAVVNNELYCLESSSNQVKKYMKKRNTWKVMGRVPVRADCNRGWGVAFKSMGNELLVIGSDCCVGGSMAIYRCCPTDVDSESGQQQQLEWKGVDSGRNGLSHFILNCSVMVA